MFFGRVNSFELALFIFNTTGSVAVSRYFCIIMIQIAIQYKENLTINSMIYSRLKYINFCVLKSTKFAAF